jgi:hypothetical protein
MGVNIFTTDHPLAAQSSGFNWKKHPVLSFSRNAVVLGLVFTPGTLVTLYRFVTGDIGAEPTPFPKPWLALVIGLAFSFVFSVVLAVMVLSAFHLLIRFFRLLCERNF